MKIALLITFFIFVSAGPVCAIYFLSLTETDCLKIDQVRVILDKSRQLEEQGQLQSARQGYKQIDLYACRRSDEQRYAIDRMMMLGKNIHQAYDVTMELIAIYHQKHGEYPSDLGDIRAFVPDNYLQAFNGFRLITKDDGTVDIVTGLYGSVSFRLN
ncbi:hypothetical protein [Corallincola spongiicola]|uniref:DUF3718 domain-containing protein n=1 Tax=Corallincola spongiicola TaxID=2520508 RepID=A0ABY1WMQ8_9GAMM|nr:hypothetical protein [Corallincola spongiicola]TAA43700.1 hypothetical protein EXY25_14210 [Corallincola spongiicola]